MIRFSMIFMAFMVPAWANAQVVVNPAALQQLAGISPPPVEMPAPPRPAAHHLYRKRIAQKPALAVRPPSPIIPVIAKPAAPPPPPPPKPAAPPRIGAAEVDFAAGSAALPTGAPAALKPICAGAGQGMVAIDAYAPADPSDPSAAMRLSLSRAFALRDALTACGVPAAHIIPRADGAAAPNTGAAKITLGSP